MSRTITITTSDGSVEFPVAFLSYSELLIENIAAVCEDIDTTLEEWVEELPEDTELLIPILTVREVDLYRQWCEIRPFIENSDTLKMYIDEYEEQMRLQKPHVTGSHMDSPLPRRMTEEWTLESLVDNPEILQRLFRLDYNHLCVEAQSIPIPQRSPFYHPPEWVLHLSSHEIPEEFPKELLWYWLKEWHFVDLNGLEIPFDSLILNAYLRGQETGEEQQQETRDNNRPIVLDFLCDNLQQLIMPETDPSAEGTMEEKLIAAEKRLRDTVFIPTNFPPELTEQWLLMHLDDRTIVDSEGRLQEISEETLQEYYENENRHLKAIPHTDSSDPLWGIGAEIGELVLLGGEKFLDPWLEDAARWRLSEIQGLIRTPQAHMRIMKYYNTPRTLQFMTECYHYSSEE